MTVWSRDVERPLYWNPVMDEYRIEKPAKEDLSPWVQGNSAVIVLR